MNDFTIQTNPVGEKYLYEVNRNAFSTTDSKAIFSKFYGDQLWGKDKLFVISGTDSGLLIRYILSGDVPAGNRYIFVELDALIPIVKKLLSDISLPDFIRLVKVSEWAGLSEELGFEDYVHNESMFFVRSIAAIDGYLSEYFELNAAIDDRYRDFVWHGALIGSKRSYIGKQLKNLYSNRTPAIKLHDVFKGKTAVILAGGPSLDQNLEWINKNRQNIVIIAVSRVIRRLKELSVHPHIVVSVDPKDDNFHVSKEMLMMDPSVLLINSYHLEENLLALWPGRSVYIGDIYPWETRNNPENIAKLSGPTVANIAVDLVRLMGFSQVLLAGVDLCYSKEGYTHAKGNPEFDKGPNIGHVSVKIPTYGGDMVDTQVDYFNALKMLEIQAKRSAEFGCVLKNLSLTAAKIDGIDYVSAEDVEFEIISGDIEDILLKTIGLESQEEINHHLNVIKKELFSARKHLVKIVELSSEALKCNDNLFIDNKVSPDFTVNKERIDKIEKLLDTRHKKVANVVKEFGAEDYLKIPPRSREWKEEDIKKVGEVYYNAYLFHSRVLLELVEQAERRVNFYTTGDFYSLNLIRLLEAWDVSKRPSAVTEWVLGFSTENKFVEPAYKDEVESHITRLRQAFSEKGEEKASEKHFTLDGVRGKLALMFKNQNPEGINHVLMGLEKIEKSEMSENLTSLANGYIFELHEQFENSLMSYMQIVDRSADLLHSGVKIEDPVLEDALQRISSIAMSHSDYDTAELAVSALAAFSENYLPLYAELLMLSGKYQDAITVYSDYIITHPEDHMSMMKLATLYKGLEQYESALWLCNHVLEADPENKTAQMLKQEITT